MWMQGLVLVASLCLLNVCEAKKAPYFLSVGSGMKMPNIVRDKYHTTEALLNDLAELENRCDVLTRHEIEAIDPRTNLPRKTSAYTLTDLTVPKEKKQRFMLTFGIHGREYISSETALYLAHFVCQKAGTHKSAGVTANLQTHVTMEAVPKTVQAVSATTIEPNLVQLEAGQSAGMNATRLQHILMTTEIMFVPVLNIDGRKKLENGDSCTAQRKNGRNVDVNRNFADWFNPNNAQPTDEDYQGPSAMSEWESNIVKVLGEKFRPHAFIDVHSGDLGLGYVFGHSGQEKSPHDSLNREWTQAIRHEVFNDKIWAGNLANMGSSPYESHGSSCDYMYASQGARISGTWEIWRKPSFFDGPSSGYSVSSGSASSTGGTDTHVMTIPIVKQADLIASMSDPNALQVEATAHHIDSEDVLIQTMVDSTGRNDQLGLELSQVQSLVQTLKQEGKAHDEIQVLLQDMSREQCFAYFNPIMPEHYDHTVSHFTMAVLLGAEKLSSRDLVEMMK